MGTSEDDALCATHSCTALTMIAQNMGMRLQQKLAA